MTRSIARLFATAEFLESCEQL